MGNSNETATSPSKQLSSSQSPPVPARNAPAGAPDCAYYVKINHPPTLSGWPAPPDGDKQELAVAVAEPVYPTNAEPGAGKKQEQAAAAECCPRVPDCVYYVKFGRCKLGMNCKFNHPRKQCECPAPAAAPKQQEAAAEYARHCNEVLDCFYYVKMGSCKNGINCKFNHPPGKLLGKRSGGGVNSGISDEASTTEYNVVPRSNVPVAAEISPATNKHKETQKVVSSSPSSKKSGKRKRIEGYGLLVCESSGTTFFQRGTKRKILSWPKDRSTARASAQAGGSGHATVHLQNNAKNSGGHRSKEPTYRAHKKAFKQQKR